MSIYPLMESMDPSSDENNNNVDTVQIGYCLIRDEIHDYNKNAKNTPYNPVLLLSSGDREPAHRDD